MQWDLVTRERVKQLVQSDDVWGTTLLVLSLDMLGPECLQWLPQSLNLELMDRLGYQIPSNNLDKLLAAREILVADDFYRRLPFFLTYANALAGDGMPLGQIVPATAAECAWAVLEATLLSPPESESEGFSEEILAYIGQVLREEGFVRPPGILRTAIMVEPHFDYGNLSPEDSEMFAAAFQDAEQRVQELDEQLKEDLQSLIDQLRSLPLANGSTKLLPQLA